MNELLKGIYRIGVCDLWSKRITGNETEEQLLKLFSREPQIQEFCFSNDFPGLDWLKRNADIAEKYGVIVNREITSMDPFFVAAFGSAKINLHCSQYCACCAAARHDATINITAIAGAIVHIDLYDNAKVNKIVVPEGVKLTIVRR